MIEEEGGQKPQRREFWRFYFEGKRNNQIPKEKKRGVLPRHCPHCGLKEEGRGRGWIIL